MADLLSTDIGDAAVHVASAAAAVSWVQEQAHRRFTAAAFQTLAKDGSTGSCPAGFGIEQDYRMYKVRPVHHGLAKSIHQALVMSLLLVLLLEPSHIAQGCSEASIRQQHALAEAVGLPD